jgi:hypothetical protein
MLQLVSTAFVIAVVTCVRVLGSPPLRSCPDCTKSVRGMNGPERTIGTKFVFLLAGCRQAMGQKLLAAQEFNWVSVTEGITFSNAEVITLSICCRAGLELGSEALATGRITLARRSEDKTKDDCG